VVATALDHLILIIHHRTMHSRRRSNSSSNSTIRLCISSICTSIPHTIHSSIKLLRIISSTLARNTHTILTRITFRLLMDRSTTLPHLTISPRRTTRLTATRTPRLSTTRVMQVHPTCTARTRGRTQALTLACTTPHIPVTEARHTHRITLSMGSLHRFSSKLYV
jgi:hypothetical protein